MRNKSTDAHRPDNSASMVAWRTVSNEAFSCALFFRLGVVHMSWEQHGMLRVYVNRSVVATRLFIG